MFTKKSLIICMACLGFTVLTGCMGMQDEPENITPTVLQTETSPAVIETSTPVVETALPQAATITSQITPSSTPQVSLEPFKCDQNFC